VTLDDILAEAFACLAAGVAEHGSPFRTLTLATVDASGSPDTRTIVLRGFDRAANVVSLHTDSRAAKYGQILANPAVALLFWDKQRRLQLRLRGRATLHGGDATARAAWAALPNVARQLYRVRQAPGTQLPDPSAAQYGEGPEALGFAAFVVIEVAFDRLEALHLTDTGQIRARFDFLPGGVQAAWLVP